MTALGSDAARAKEYCRLVAGEIRAEGRL